MSDYADLFDTVADGLATDADRSRLADLLRGDGDAMAAFIRHMDLHTALRRAVNARPVTQVRKPDPSPPRATARVGFTLRFPRVTLALAAALLLAAGGFAIHLASINPQSPIRVPQTTTASVLDVSEGTLMVDDQIASPGEAYAGREVSLDSGEAEFMLPNQVAVRMRGATRLMIHDAMNVSMAGGAAEFDCPPGAKGYTVHLPDRSRIVDLGTAFRVEIDERGRAGVHVTEGQVRWMRGDDDPSPVVIAAGQTARLIDGRIVPAANPGLVAYWPLNDGPAGSTVTGADDLIDDPDHPATDATVEGAGDTWVDDPERGIVLSTTATGNLIAGTQGITGDFTWSLWIKTTDESSHVIMGNRAGSGPWNRLTPTFTENWAHVGDRLKGTSFGVADGRWHHMIYRRAGDTVGVWIDGERYTQTATQTEPTNGPLRIGGDLWNGQMLVGLLSDVAVWSIALDESRIRQLAAGGPVMLPDAGAATDQPESRPNEPADRSDGHRDTERPSSEK